MSPPKVSKPEAPPLPVAPVTENDKNVKDAGDRERKRLFSTNGRMGTYIANPSMFGTGKTRTGD